MIPATDDLKRTPTEQGQGRRPSAESSAVRRPNGQIAPGHTLPHPVPRKVPFLREAALDVMNAYVSKRTKEVGIRAYLADMLEADPKWFLSQVVKIEPRSLSVTSQQRSLKVVMHIDEPRQIEAAGSDNLRYDALAVPDNATSGALPTQLSESETKTVDNFTVVKQVKDNGEREQRASEPPGDTDHD